MKDKFKFFGIGSALYALFYTFCMYKNGAGITYPFAVGGSIFFFCLCMRKLEISVKRNSIWYFIALLLLSISTFCTADGRILLINKLGVFLLTVSFLLHQFYEDDKWSFVQYIVAIFSTTFGSVGRIHKPFQHFLECLQKKGEKKGKGLYILIGVAIAIPLFMFVWVLLLSADKIFMDLTVDMFKFLKIGNLVGMFFTAAFMFFTIYCVLNYLEEKRFKEFSGERKRIEAALAITVTLPLTIMYILFSVIQVFGLFMGKINLAATTYAEYARSGFFQLVAICILNLVIVLVGNAYFSDSISLKIILTIMSLCTYIMIASAGMRMILYIKHYYLTFLRILVLWSLVVIFMLLTGVLVNIYKSSFPLFRYGTAVVTIFYLLLSFSKPDYLIARCNLGNVTGTQVHSFFDADAYHDYAYLCNLSTDAAPIIIPYLEKEGYDIKRMEKEEEKRYYIGSRMNKEEWGYFYLKGVYSDIEDLNVRSFNISRHMAAQMLAKY